MFPNISSSHLDVTSSIYFWMGSTASTQVCFVDYHVLNKYNISVACLSGMTIYCSFLASQDYTNMAVVTRWFDGLVNKDLDITNEIYSLREVDFDRQVSLVKDYACPN